MLIDGHVDSTHGCRLVGQEEINYMIQQFRARRRDWCSPTKPCHNRFIRLTWRVFTDHVAKFIPWPALAIFNSSCFGVPLFHGFRCFSILGKLYLSSRVIALAAQLCNLLVPPVKMSVAVSSRSYPHSCVAGDTHQVRGGTTRPHCLLTWQWKRRDWKIRGLTWLELVSFLPVVHHEQQFSTSQLRGSLCVYSSLTRHDQILRERLALAKDKSMFRINVW